MTNHKKDPGKRSDRPGIMPKALDLDVFPTCLERERERPFGCLWSGWWKGKRAIRPRVTWFHNSAQARTARGTMANRPPANFNSRFNCQQSL